jgi:hypothetical protein
MGVGSKSGIGRVCECGCAVCGVLLWEGGVFLVLRHLRRVDLLVKTWVRSLTLPIPAPPSPGLYCTTRPRSTDDEASPTSLLSPSHPTSMERQSDVLSCGKPREEKKQEIGGPMYPAPINKYPPRRSVHPAVTFSRSPSPPLSTLPLSGLVK